MKAKEPTDIKGPTWVNFKHRPNGGQIFLIAPLANLFGPCSATFIKMAPPLNVVHYYFIRSTVSNFMLFQLKRGGRKGLEKR